MKAVAYCAQSFADVARQVIGGEPVTCPWVDANTFDFASLKAADFWYIDLHGELGYPMWFGDNGITALRADQLEKADLGNLVIFAANCYLADDNSPMLHALLASKPVAVIAAPGKNFSPPSGSLYGAALLAKWFYRLFRLRFSLDRSLSLAKLRLDSETIFVGPESRAVIEKANADAKEFQIYRGK